MTADFFFWASLWKLTWSIGGIIDTCISFITDTFKAFPDCHTISIVATGYSNTVVNGFDHPAITISNLFISRTTNTMKFGFWQGKTIRWSGTGIIRTNNTCFIKSIHSTTWIKPSRMSFWSKFWSRRTFVFCKVNGLFWSAFCKPFRISFIFAKIFKIIYVISLFDWP